MERASSQSFKWQCKFGSPINKHEARIRKFEFGVYAPKGGGFGFRVHNADKPNEVYFVASEGGMTKRLIDTNGKYYHVEMTEAERKNVGRLLELAYRKTKLALPPLEGLARNDHETALAILEKARKKFAES